MRLKILVTALVFVSVCSFASDKPAEKEEAKLPPAGENTALFKGMTAEKWFAKRDSAGELEVCRTRFPKALEEHDTIRGKLDAVVATRVQENIEKMEKEWLDLRAEVLKLAAKCGGCHTAEVKAVEVAGELGAPEYWYRADASCLWGKKEAYNAVRDSMRLRSRYIAPTRGFPALLALLPYDATSEEFEKNAEKLEKFPFLAYIGLRGPMLLDRLGYAKLFEVKWDEKKDPKGVYLTLESVEEPRGFTPPALKDDRPLGTAPKVKILESGTVKSLWYFNDERYVRFVLVGQFTKKVPFFELQGPTIALDTALELSQRYR